MNDRRRDKLRRAIEFLERASDIIDGAMYDECECMDNIPESLQGSRRYERMEDICDQLSDACERCDDALKALKEAIR